MCKDVQKGATTSHFAQTHAIPPFIVTPVSVHPINLLLEENIYHHRGTPPLSVCLLAPRSQRKREGIFKLTIGVFWLTVKLLCLQSLKVVIQRAFPL